MVAIHLLIILVKFYFTYINNFKKILKKNIDQKTDIYKGLEIQVQKCQNNRVFVIAEIGPIIMVLQKRAKLH